MSVSNIRIALKRIKTATVHSPVAVFKVHGSEDMVNVVFESTVLTSTLLESDDYIGSYHKAMDLGVVQAELTEALAQ